MKRVTAKEFSTKLYSSFWKQKYISKNIIILFGVLKTILIFDQIYLVKVDTRNEHTSDNHLKSLVYISEIKILVNIFLFA